MGDSPAIMGEPKDVLKRLEKIVDQWKEKFIPRSDIKLRLGRVVINGMAMAIAKEQTNLLSDDSSVKLVVRVPNPVQNGAELSASFFGSAEALFTRGVELEEGGAVVKALGPLGPAACGVFAGGGEHGRALGGVVFLEDQVDLRAGELPEFPERGGEGGGLKLFVDAHGERPKGKAGLTTNGH